MGKLDKEPVLHSLSCSPKRVWPASSWEIQGWRGFWRRAKSPVKKRKLQSAWLKCITVLNMFKKGGWDCKCSESLHDNYLQKSAVLTFSYHVSKGILQEINTFPWWFLGVILNNTAFNHIVYKWKRNGYMKDILRETIKHTAEMLRADFTFVHFVF